MSDLMDVSREEGVHDLHLSVRRWFAKALLAERTAGRTTDEALGYLAQAIAEEAKSKV